MLSASALQLRRRRRFGTADRAAGRLRITGAAEINCPGRASSARLNILLRRLRVCRLRTLVNGGLIGEEIEGVVRVGLRAALIAEKISERIGLPGAVMILASAVRILRLAAPE